MFGWKNPERWLTIGLAVLVLFALAMVAGTAFAGGTLPEGVEVFNLGAEGLTCVVWPDGSGDCYCPCDVCDEIEVIYETPTNSDSTPTRLPPTGTPVDTPVPPTNTPEPTDKPKCNRGLGNGSENCDPGNSGGKPGSAGEDNE